ncbi:Hypothetical Protein FCC1311_049082 [Hondaea fermentalgiana]|uniref:Trichohyalin-plectin-homology domain-containing protein n=1 Tax=Hondaea fermentalgiana TaxID=2315210 RepID=A0A2R5GCI3_9STRA|nr:Hypothetical Protein FCC1311_049082 [Hondaea fermentalgiana]|eukprot:GBG28687.1 Hypothetical Protein FCC1311_049082 [Hondaea fermentalgiana]
MASARSGRRQHLTKLLADSTDGTVVGKRAALQKEIKTKLVAEYAPPRSAQEARAYFESGVESEVNDLFRRCHRARIGEAHLRELEDRVRALAVDAHTRPATRASTSEQKTQGVLDLPQDDFQTLMEYDRVKHMTEAQKRVQDELARKRAVKDALDEQVRDVHARRERERKEEEVYGQKMYDDARAYERQVAENRQRELERFQHDKELREKQLAARREAEQKARERKDREEAAELERIRAELAREEARRLERIAQEQANYEAFTVELAEQRKRREVEKKRLWEEDIQRSKEYAAKLEREEQNRLKHLDMLKQKASSNQQQFLLATADARAREIADQERIDRVQKQRREADQARAAKLADARKKASEHAQRVNQELIAVKVEAKRQERIEFHESAKVAKELAAQQRQIDLEAKRRQLQNAQDLRDALDRQVEEKRASEEDVPTRMSAAEARINIDRFQAISRDPEVHELVKRTFKPHARAILKAAKAERKQETRVRTSYYH